MTVQIRKLSSTVGCCCRPWLLHQSSERIHIDDNNNNSSRSSISSSSDNNNNDDDKNNNKNEKHGDRHNNNNNSNNNNDKKTRQPRQKQPHQHGKSKIQSPVMYPLMQQSCALILRGKFCPKKNLNNNNNNQQQPQPATTYCYTAVSVPFRRQTAAADAHL
ncbi:unnamed protein product [Polarella glacialis]|uniref:Uncharacterized protein n=1 Tax=Polarella glacialis TaxID=89957 RepID=A0A813ITB5_POLGL|nr:unnamed protein product [Polarella glacialis]